MMENKPKLIFTVTAGRTGTMLLARLFSLFPNVCSRHEPSPNFISVMRESQNDMNLAKEFLIQKKLPSIAHIGTDYYFESSHLFCKGFFEPLAEITKNVSIIALRRKASEIAYSLLSRKTVPGRTWLGNNYLLHPDDPNVIPIANWETSMTDYQLCYWYALEIERRQIKYQKTCTALGLNFFELFTHEVPKLDVFTTMCKKFGISVPQDRDFHNSFHDVASFIHNKNTNYLEIDESWDDQEMAVWTEIKKSSSEIAADLEAHQTQGIR